MRKPFILYTMGVCMREQVVEALPGPLVILSGSRLMLNQYQRDGIPEVREVRYNPDVPFRAVCCSNIKFQPMKSEAITLLADSERYVKSARGRFIDAFRRSRVKDKKVMIMGWPSDPLQVWYLLRNVSCHALLGTMEQYAERYLFYQKWDKVPTPMNARFRPEKLAELQEIVMSLVDEELSSPKKLSLP